MHAGVDIGLLSLGFPIGIALFFVAVLYGIGALYNDRSDRSALFWKSLPISDAAHGAVEGRVAMALVAPVLADGAMIALAPGLPGPDQPVRAGARHQSVALLWSPTHLVGLWVKLVLLIPVNALWAAAAASAGCCCARASHRSSRSSGP